jgi:hypothetical protein
MVGTILIAGVLATAEEDLAVSVKQEEMYIAGQLVAAGVWGMDPMPLSQS